MQDTQTDKKQCLSSATPPLWHRQMGSEGYGQFISCCFCPCSERRVLPLLQCGASHTETVLCKLLQCDSLFHRVPSFKNSLFQCGSTNPTRKPALAWAPLSTGIQVPAEPCSSMGLPPVHSSLLSIDLLWCGSLQGL